MTSEDFEQLLTEKDVIREVQVKAHHITASPPSQEMAPSLPENRASRQISRVGYPRISGSFYKVRTRAGSATSTQAYAQVCGEARPPAAPCCSLS